MNNVGKPALYGLTQPIMGKFFPRNRLSSIYIVSLYDTIIYKDLYILTFLIAFLFALVIDGFCWHTSWRSLKSRCGQWPYKSYCKYLGLITTG
jgi:hypothetical protein